MVSSDLGRSVAEGFLFVANMLNTVTINNMVIPDLVQIGNSSGAVLDCQFTAADDRFTLQWLFNRAEDPVYEWSPGTPPKASGILEGRLDPAYRVSNERLQEGRAIRIAPLVPELSGEYTCRVLGEGGEARQTKAMLVFSPEREFVIELHHGHHDMLDIKCSARGIYPQPELTLEYNHEPLPRQEQRVWRGEGLLYDAKSSTRLRARSGRVTCRLQVPSAGYTALRTKQLHPKSTHENNKQIEHEKKRPNHAPGLEFVHALVFLSLITTLKDLCI